MLEKPRKCFPILLIYNYFIRGKVFEVIFNGKGSRLKLGVFFGKLF